MPTPTKGPRLGGGPAHERLMLANLATSLFEHDRITTTEAKAKRLRPLAERLVTFAKRGDLHSRRRVLTVVKDKGVVHRLFAEIAPDMELRAGGYTRITKVGARKGDNAPMAVIELVREPLSARKATVKEAEAATRRSAKQAEAATAASDPKPVDHTGSTVDADHPGDVKERPLFDGPEAPGDAEGTPADTTAGDDTGATHAGDGTDVTEGEYGAGSAAPNEDGSAPAGYDIKGNKDSMKYHEPDGQWYDQTVAEVWFKTAADAEKAGFEKAGGSH